MKNKAHLQLSFAAEQPLQRIAMDIITCTPRGNQYIPVLGDYFTKWKEAFLLANIEASSIARVVVNEFICQFYNFESDGLVERFNRTLIDMLSMAVSDNERDWDLQIPTLLLAYRTSMQA